MYYKCMYIKAMDLYKKKNKKTKTTSAAPIDLNVTMQITFMFSVEDLHLLVALVTEHYMIHLTHRSCCPH